MNDTGLEQKDLRHNGVLILGSTGGLYEFQSPLKWYEKFPGHVSGCTALERRLMAFISCSNGF